MHTPPRGPRPRRQRLQRITPQPGSLYDILHDNAGDSLFLRPQHWTDLHTRLLGCRFVRLPPHEMPTPPASCPSSFPPSPPNPPSPQNPSQTTPPSITAIGRRLKLLMSAEKPDAAKTTTLATIMSALFPRTLNTPRHNSNLGLRFGSRFYHDIIYCQIKWKLQRPPTTSHPSFDSTSTLTPSHSISDVAALAPVEQTVLAYISRSHLDRTRRAGCHIMSGPKGIPNHPVHRLQVLRAKSLAPKNVDEDTYFVAAMIGLAQEFVYRNIWSGEGFTPRDVKVHLMTVAEEENAFIVYTAIVPAALLRMFDDPAAAPTGNSEIRVEYVQVPAWPVLGLNERLGKALGADIVDDLDVAAPPSLDEEDLPPWETRASPKRKRAVSSEGANASFSEDRDHLRSKFQKKRRIETTPDTPPDPRRPHPESRRCGRRETGITGLA
ncbi:hypothetical protein GQX73_g7103 [Xylaria multiplex]|uniref:Uncharacterized protein n=1 Tax=Xylaria multiplex TaxID=323545 RepID=A0A7C8ILI2_9PEZI|nr:hypothetical protein GQX73_g7103 [Xylaria multiplex]